MKKLIKRKGSRRARMPSNRGRSMRPCAITSLLKSQKWKRLKLKRANLRVLK